MTKKFFLFLTAALIAGATMNVYAESVLIDGLYYILDEEHLTATVTYKSTNSSEQADYATGTVNVPATVTDGVKTYNVTTIGSAAFKSCRNMTSITIAEGITKIGEGTSQSEGAFYSAYGLQEAKLPSTLTQMAPYAFCSCRALQEIEIPASLTEIPWCAFLDCTNLISVKLNEGLTTIGEEAFSNVKISDITLPASLTTIQANAFAHCKSIKSITVKMTTPPNIKQGDGDVPTGMDYQFYWDDNKGKDRTNNVFYESGISIGSYYYGIRDITLWVPLESLEAYMEAEIWGECLNIMAEGYGIYTYNGLRYKRNPVAHTAELTFSETFDVSNSNTNQQISYATGEIAIPQQFTDDHDVTYTVTSIGDYALFGCSNITALTLPSTIKTIGQNAFYYCSRISSINLPDGLTKLGNKALQYTALTSVQLPTSLTEIGKYAFGGTRITEVVVPEGITVLYGTFASCAYLESVSLPSTLKTIYYIFSSCTKLKSVQLPDGVTTIGENSFRNCTSLSEINLPEGLVYIRSSAFSNTAIETIDIPSTVTTISDNAFNNCTQLKEIYARMTTPPTINANVFEGCATDLSTIVCYVPASVISTYKNKLNWKSFTIASLEPIEKDGLFYELSVLTKKAQVTYKSSDLEENKDYVSGAITIPAKVTFDEQEYDVIGITKNAFVGNTGLTAVTLPTSIETIGKEAFKGCTALASINLTEAMTVIEDNTFQNTGLTTLTVPENITRIGNYAFAGCTSLAEVILTGTTTLEQSAFSGCSALQSVNLGDVETIGAYAFANTQITKLSLPASLTTVGANAFNGNNTLTEIEVYILTPLEINANVFDNCGTLSNIKLLVPTEAYEAYKTADVWKEFNVQPLAGWAHVVFKAWKDGVENVVIQEEDVIIGTAATEPDVPEREGWIFTGWDNEFDNVTGDLVVTAQYKEDSSTAINGLPTNDGKVVKTLHNGQLFIEKNGKIFNAQGAEVK